MPVAQGIPEAHALARRQGFQGFSLRRLREWQLRRSDPDTSEFENRAAFTGWMEQRGVSRQTAMWLAMNVRALPNTTRFVFRLDLAGIRAMLEEAWRHDPAWLAEIAIWTEDRVYGAAEIEAMRPAR